MTQSLHCLLNQSGIACDDVPDLPITNITANSAQCTQDTLFIATKGATQQSRDGHDFIDQAIAQGAVAVVVNHDYPCVKTHAVPIIYVPDSKRALCFLAEAFFDFPSRRLAVIGITGTNGKTSTSFMLHSILREAKGNPNVMGTLGMGDPGSLIALSHTTMDPIFISESLARMHAQGVTHVIMEISSHALSLQRVEALRFAACALTNITQDHLDFHETFANYRDAKARLFFELAHEQTQIVWPHDHPFTQTTVPISTTYFGAQGSHVWFSDIKEHGLTTQFILHAQNQEHHVSLPFLGEFHVKNACTAATLALALNIDLTTITKGLAACMLVPGRLEPVRNNHGLRVFVDYAHTPDALSLLLQTLTKLHHDRIILVFGCGGDRDQGKRPLMGAIAAEYAQLIVVTDDNPRTEEPHQIRAQILLGMSSPAHHYEIADRQQAIQFAIKQAQKNDIVVIAGKGHESYQLYGKTCSTFSDLDEAQRILEAL